MACIFPIFFVRIYDPKNLNWKTMKYDEKFKKFIIELVEEYRSDVFAGEYSYTIIWEDKDVDAGNGEIYGASIEIEATYLRFKLTIYPNLQRDWKNKEYNQLKRDIMHEMCHLLTEPLENCCHSLLKGCLETEGAIKEKNERQTQRIANSLMFLKNDIEDLKKQLKNATKKKSKRKKKKK